MNYNNLACRCGCNDAWYLEWAYTGIFELNLCCDKCGAIFMIAKSDNENCKVKDII